MSDATINRSTSGATTRIEVIVMTAMMTMIIEFGDERRRGRPAVDSRPSHAHLFAVRLLPAVISARSSRPLVERQQCPVYTAARRS